MWKAPRNPRNVRPKSPGDGHAGGAHEQEPAEGGEHEQRDRDRVGAGGAEVVDRPAVERVVRVRELERTVRARAPRVGKAQALRAVEVRAPAELCLERCLDVVADVRVVAEVFWYRIERRAQAADRVRVGELAVLRPVVDHPLGAGGRACRAGERERDQRCRKRNEDGQGGGLAMAHRLRRPFGPFARV
jgi:hypothetical protein